MSSVPASSAVRTTARVPRRATGPATPVLEDRRPHALHTLQRQYGNQAVQRLIGSPQVRAVGAAALQGTIGNQATLRLLSAGRPTAVPVQSQVLPTVQRAMPPVATFKQETGGGFFATRDAVLKKIDRELEQYPKLPKPIYTYEDQKPYLSALDRLDGLVTEWLSSHETDETELGKKRGRAIERLRDEIPKERRSVVRPEEEEWDSPEREEGDPFKDEEWDKVEATRGSGMPDSLSSYADPTLLVTDQMGVISVVAAGSGTAHTIVYVEAAYKNGERLQPRNQRLDLTVDEHGVVSINVTEASLHELMLLRHAGDKRAWQRSLDQLNAALNKANTIRLFSEKYSYTRIGTSPFDSRAVNCAAFGERILQAAGLDVSAGRIVKTPMELATGTKSFQKSASEPKDERKAEDALGEVIDYERTNQPEHADEMFVTALQLARSPGMVNHLLKEGDLEARRRLMTTLLNSPNATIRRWIETHLPRAETQGVMWAAIHDWAKDPSTRASASFSCALTMERAGDLQAAKHWFEMAAAEAGKAGVKQLEKAARDKLRQLQGPAAPAAS